MSSDATAILFFGFPIDDEDVDFDCDEDGDSYHDWNDEWKSLKGPPKPDDPDYKSPEWDSWIMAPIAKLNAVEMREELRAYEASARHVEIDFSGGEDCEQYFVHCPGLCFKVYWNDLREISASDLEYPKTQKAACRAIEEFCKKFGIPFRVPQWHLAARYF